MPTFETPNPITLSVELGAGELHVIASDRHDTVVDVQPGHAGKTSDANAAAQTRVEYADGRLVVRAPRGWRSFGFRGARESVRVEVALPAGSTLEGDAGAGQVRTEGPLGECRFKIGAGDIELAEARAVQLKTGAGAIRVGHTAGNAECVTGSGAVHVGRVDGTAIVKNANGSTTLGVVTGDLRVTAANGSVSVDEARSSVVAKTANGSVDIGAVSCGAVVAETAMGRVRIGVVDGVAAWLDLNTQFGQVRSDLDASERPAPGEPTVEVRARTSFGDITISKVAGDAARVDRGD